MAVAVVTACGSSLDCTASKSESAVEATTAPKPTSPGDSMTDATDARTRRWPATGSAIVLSSLLERPLDNRRLLDCGNTAVDGRAVPSDSGP